MGAVLVSSLQALRFVCNLGYQLQQGQVIPDLLPIEMTMRALSAHNIMACAEGKAFLSLESHLSDRNVRQL